MNSELQPGIAETSPEERFWEWFLQNEEMLLGFRTENADREEILDAIHLQLIQIDENLSFEIGPPAAKREFILAGGGIRESYPSVIRLQQCAPLLERWEVIAFRPRRWPSGIIEMGRYCVDSKQVFFKLLTKERIIGLELFFPGFTNDTDFRQIAYLFLDEALGEFDSSTKIGYLRFLSTDEPEEYERHPFRNLPSDFDRLYERLNGFSGKPS